MDEPTCPDCVAEGVATPGPAALDGKCRRHYQQAWRARKRAGEGAVTDPAVHPACRCGCGVPVRLVGARRRRYLETGVAPFASMACRDKGKRVTITCARDGCEGTREVARSYAARAQRMFCSRECFDAVGSKPRRGRSVPCDNPACAELVYVQPGQEGTRRWHSIACRRAAEQAQRLEKSCAVCGDPFEVIPAKTEQAHCSRLCTFIGRTTRIVPGPWHNGRPKRYDQSGYVLLYEPDHPAAGRYGWIFEHRLVMEQQLGRPLSPREQVDHVNEVKDDNRPENLRVMTPSAHSSRTNRSTWARRRADADELALRRAGYRPVGEVLDEALAILQAHGDTLAPEDLARLAELSTRLRQPGGGS